MSFGVSLAASVALCASCTDGEAAIRTPQSSSGSSAGSSQTASLPAVPPPAPKAQPQAQDPGKVLPRPVESIPPYVLSLGSDHATICWMTSDERVGRLKLLSYDGEQEHVEAGAASHYHKVAIEGLLPARTYRYRIGNVYEGTFRTADGSDEFQVAVFGHPGGTENPLEYPTELLAAQLQAIAPDFALCTGDITFRATLRDFRDGFFHRFGDFMSRRPIYVSPANHEGRRNGRNYSQFRRLFPHDFGPEHGGSYWFDYKHARFYALTYKLNTKEMFREHVEWLCKAIDASDQEFNIVFLGGQEPKYYDRDLLFRSLAGRPVDIVFGGDGGGVWQKKLHGLDFFFSGDGSMGAFPFYYLRFHAHHFDVETRHSDASRATRRYGSYYSKKPRQVLLDLKSKRVEGGKHEARYANIGVDSRAMDGLQFDLDWPFDKEVELQVVWKGEKQSITKVQAHMVKPKTKRRILVEIPSMHPVASPGVPYVLDSFTIQLARYRGYYDKHPLSELVSNVALFAR